MMFKMIPKYGLALVLTLSVLGCLPLFSRQAQFRGITNLEMDVKITNRDALITISGLNVDSALSVKKVSFKKIDNEILVSVYTSPLFSWSKGKTPVVHRGKEELLKSFEEQSSFSNLQPGLYELEYLDPDGTKHLLKSFSIE